MKSQATKLVDIRAEESRKALKKGLLVDFLLWITIGPAAAGVIAYSIVGLIS